MLIQKLRGRIGSRLSGNSESGFTLIELLVVMLILGILAAIAIPAFFNQKSKANDSKAKAVAHTGEIAMETCATDNNGQYTNCDYAALKLIEPALPAAAEFSVPTHLVGNYKVTATSSTGSTFSIVRATTGVVTFPCTVTSANRGGCPGAGVAEGVWGS
jgi:type IV pilus assembly protein PilA